MKPTAAAERKQSQNKILYLGTHSCIFQHQAVLASYIVEIGHTT